MIDETGNAAAEASDRPRWLRDTVLFLGGQTVSLLGSMLVQYAVFWYLTIEYKSGSIMALAAIFGFLPQALVSVFGGVWADRHNRKLLIIGADAAIAVSTLALALVMMSGYDAVWLIFLTMAVRSAGAGIQMPAVSAIIPQIVPTRHLIRVNGLNGSIQSTMALVAPAAAGAIYAWASATLSSAVGALIPIFFIDVVTAAIGIGLIALIPVTAVRRTGDVQPGYFADLADGVRYVAHHAFVRWLLLLFAIVFLLTVAPSNLTPLMAVRSFDAGAQQNVVNLAVLEIMFSVGMILGGVLVATVYAKRSRIGLIITSSLLFGALSIGLGLSPNIWVFFGFMFLVGIMVPFFSTSSMTLLQETVEPERQGRVFGFVGIVMAVAMPLGMAILGPLADQVPIEWLLVGAGVLTFVVVGAAVGLPAGRRAVAAAQAASQITGHDAAAAAAVVEATMHRPDSP
ncbi:MFS transporter [Microbacterium sp. P5_E9]